MTLFIPNNSYLCDLYLTIQSSQINDLGLVPSMGDYSRFNQVVNRVRSTGNIDILALGGSITAGGYFMEFTRSLKEKSNLNVTVHNHGHGATEITCELIFYMKKVSMKCK